MDMMDKLHAKMKEEIVKIIRSTSANTFAKASEINRLTKTPYNMTDKEICEKTEISLKYVQNLLRVYRGLHPTILKAWSRNEDGTATDLLNKYTTMSPKEQLKTWKARSKPAGIAKVARNTTGKIAAFIVTDNKFTKSGCNVRGCKSHSYAFVGDTMGVLLLLCRKHSLKLQNAMTLLFAGSLDD